MTVEPDAPEDRFARADHPSTILQVIPELETGGAERGCLDVAAAVVRAGGRGLVVSAGGPMVHELERSGAEHLTWPVKGKNPLTLWRNAGRLVDLIRAEGVDIIHARSRAPAWSAFRAARRTGIPFVTTFHAPYNFRSGLKRAYNSVMARGDRVIAVSQFIADHIHEHYAPDTGAVTVIQRGIDLGRFDPDRVDADRLIKLAQHWRVPEDKHIILLPGRLTRWKGQTVLIEAIARLGRSDIRCLMVGADQGRNDYRAELEDRARALGVLDLIEFTGHCDDMPAAYMLADVVVSASTDPEAFGRVIVEAQALGRPVIVTGHGAVQETVVEGETGLVVPPGDADSLASALAATLALTDEERAVLRGDARRHVAQNFSRERMCHDTLRVYDELLRRPGGAGLADAYAGSWPGD